MQKQEREEIWEPSTAWKRPKNTNAPFSISNMADPRSVHGVISAALAKPDHAPAAARRNPINVFTLSRHSISMDPSGFLVMLVMINCSPPAMIPQ